MEDIINQYRNVPYFNNKTIGRRAGLRVETGKGSPKEIRDEVEGLLLKEKIDIKNLNDFELKKFMVEHNIGIECSGFAYHVLSMAGRGELKKYLRFPFSNGIIGRLRAVIRPIENADVKTFTHNENSRIVSLKEIQKADMITMISNSERDHILVITKVELPIIYYAHAVAWPTDGEYGHGIHEGKIEIVDFEKPIIEQRWIELEKEGEENYTYARAKKSVTEIRRLKWFD